LRVTAVNQKQRDRWAKLRVKGEGRFVLRRVLVFTLSAVAGHILWGLLALLWRDDATPRFVRDPGSVIASVVAVAVASYFYSAWEWRKSEREFYPAGDEGGSADHTVL
jgi:hypothetical protein